MLGLCDWKRLVPTPQCRQGFRVDTFARNEGEAGGKAHFKFVFTLENGEHSVCLELPWVSLLATAARSVLCKPRIDSHSAVLCWWVFAFSFT